jgi:WD40 repeat protein
MRNFVKTRLLFLILALVLVACAQPGSLAPTTGPVTPPATLPVSATPPAPVEPSATATNPPATPTSDATPSPAVIAPGNAFELVARYRLGKGPIWAPPVYSPDGAFLAVASTTGVHFYDTQTWQEFHTYPSQGRVEQLAFSPGGDLFVTGGGLQVSLHDLPSGALVRGFEVDPGALYLLDLAYSPDGSLIAAGYGDGRVRVWSVSGGEQIYENAGNWLSFSPDGSLLAAVTGYPEYRLHLWAMPAGELVFSLDGTAENYFSVALAPDGQSFATLSSSPEGPPSGHARLWSARDGEMLLQTETENATSLAFSPDGQLLALGCLDGVIRLLSLEDGSLVAELPGHSGLVSGVAFSPDGSLLASSSDDGTVILWGLTP